METKKQNEAQETNFLQSAKKKKKTIIGVIVGVVIAAIAAGGVTWFVQSKKSKANEAIAAADLAAISSPSDTAKVVIESYEKAFAMGHDAGNRAGLELAYRYYKMGDYNKAIEYLDKSSVDSEIIEAGRLSLLGDCYANLDKYDQAIDAFNKAIKESDENPIIIPFELVKIANVYKAQGKYEDEYKTYEKILNEYPEYTQMAGVDLHKYAERAKVAAGIK